MPAPRLSVASGADWTACGQDLSQKGQGDGRCALTFDDGPDEVWTSCVLDRLRIEGAPSTFFVMADRAAAHPALINRMRAEGHEVEFHCVRHVRHDAIGESALRCDAEQGLVKLSRLGIRARYWRVPWGIVTPATRRVAAACDLELVGWDLDSHDWRGDTAVEMHARVAGGMRGGTVVLMHDGLGPGARRSDCRETLALISRLVETMRRHRLRPAPVAELVA